MKQTLYATPYENEEENPTLEGFDLEEAFNIKADITLTSPEDTDSLFRMTPYYYHTSQSDKQKLASLKELTTVTDFYIRIYRRK